MPAIRLFIIILLFLNLLAFAAIKGWLGDDQPRGEPERLTNQLRPDSIVLIGEASAVTTPTTTALTTTATRAPTSTLAANVGTSSETEARNATPNTTVPSMTGAADTVALATNAPAAAPVIPYTPPTPPAPAAPTAAASPPTPPAPPTPATPAVPPAPAAQLCLAMTKVEAPTAVEMLALVKTAAPSLQVRQAQTDAPSNWWVHIPPLPTRQAAEVRASELRSAGIVDLFIVRDPGPNQNAISLGIFRTENSARQHLNDVRVRKAADARITPRVPALMRVEIRGNADLVEEVTERLAKRWPDLNSGTCR